MSQENLQTMIIQNFGGVKEVYYGIVQVVNTWKCHALSISQRDIVPEKCLSCSMYKLPLYQ